MQQIVKKRTKNNKVQQQSGKVINGKLCKRLKSDHMAYVKKKKSVDRSQERLEGILFIGNYTEM